MSATSVESLRRFAALEGRTVATPRRFKIRGWHRFLLAEGAADADPSRDIRPPAPARRLPKALPVDTVVALLDAASGTDPRGLRDRALLELLYATGARISEAVGLDVDDVDDLGRTLDTPAAARVVLHPLT